MVFFPVSNNSNFWGWKKPYLWHPNLCGCGVIGSRTRLRIWRLGVRGSFITPINEKPFRTQFPEGKRTLWVLTTDEGGPDCWVNFFLFGKLSYLYCYARAGEIGKTLRSHKARWLQLPLGFGLPTGTGKWKSPLIEWIFVLCATEQRYFTI